MPSSPTLEVLLETKKDNLLHLQQLLTEPIYVELQKIYKHAQEKTAVDKVLENFQEQLTLIPHWNVNQVSALKERVIERMNCDYFSELLKATFMVYLQLHLATLSQKVSSSPIKIKVPSAEAFIHRLLVAVARLLWKKPYLMYEKVRSLEKQKNLLQCEAFIHKSIRQTIMNGLPLNEIYRYLSKETLVHQRRSESGDDEASPDSATDDPVHSASTSESESESASESESETEETTPTAIPQNPPVPVPVPALPTAEEAESEDEDADDETTEGESVDDASEDDASEDDVEAIETGREEAEAEEEIDYGTEEMNLVAAVEAPEANTKKIEIVSKEKGSSKSRHASLHRPVVSKVHHSGNKRPSDAFF